MEFKDVLTERYSCKNYSDKIIEKQQLLAILEAGRLAPTAKNLQEQHIYVMQSPESLSVIDQVTPCRYGAPTVLVVAYNKNEVYTYPGTNCTSGVEDAAIVATHMILAAADLGVNSCWVNNFNPQELAGLMQLPEEEEILMLMDLGFAGKDGMPLPNHASRKELSSTVSYR